MYKNLKILIAVLSLLLTTCYVLHATAPQAHAAGVGLAVSPPILQITAEPPAQIKAPVTIGNTSNDPVTLRILFREFRQSDEQNGTIVYLPEDKKTQPDSQIFQKIQVFDNGNPVQTIELSPKQEKNLEVHIDIPKDEPLSDYYFSIIFVSTQNPQSPQPNQDQNSSSTAQGGIAVNTLLSIGTEQASGFIQQFSAPAFLFKGPVPFTLSVKNTSHHVIAPEGTIQIQNLFGQTIGQLDLLPVNILSNTARFIPDANSLDRTDNAQILWPETALLGPYTATLHIKLSDNGPLFVRSVHFFALPVPAIAALIVLILIILILHERVKKKL